MARRYVTKSDNFWAAAAAGGTTSWAHVDSGNTGRITIRASTKPNSCLILCNVVVNTAGSGTSSILRDSAVGVIAVIKASVSEKDFHYNITLKGDLIIDNGGGADMTVVYITP